MVGLRFCFGSVRGQMSAMVISVVWQMSWVAGDGRENAPVRPGDKLSVIMIIFTSYASLLRFTISLLISAMKIWGLQDPSTLNPHNSGTS